MALSLEHKKELVAIKNYVQVVNKPLANHSSWCSSQSWESILTNITCRYFDEPRTILNPHCNLLQENDTDIHRGDFELNRKCSKLVFEEKSASSSNVKSILKEKYTPNFVVIEDDYKNSQNIERLLLASGKTNSIRATNNQMIRQRLEMSGIRWAPINIPLRRRLQTLVVLIHTLSMAISLSLFFFFLAIPIFWPIMIPYIIYCLNSKASTSGNLSRRSSFLRSLSVWNLFSSYFPAQLHRSQELIPTRKYIFGYHPHGIISMGAFAAFCTEALGFSRLFPGIQNSLLTLDSNFRIPIYRDYALAMGLASVSRESCENILSKGGLNNQGMGRAITIVVGGARESLDAQPGTFRLILKGRKGFIKMAIRTGADLVPVLGFGENDLYDQVVSDDYPKIHRLQLFAKKLFGFTIPLFHARGIFNYDVGLMPYRRPIIIVVGRPILIQQSPNPGTEEIDRVHKEYIKELERIWMTWKNEAAPNRKEDLIYV